MIFYFLQTSISCPEAYEIYIDGGTHIGNIVVRYGIVSLELFNDEQKVYIIKEFEDSFKGNLTEEERDEYFDEIVSILGSKVSTNEISTYRIENNIEELLDKIS